MWKPIAVVPAVLLVAACTALRQPSVPPGRYVVIETETRLDRAEDVERTLTRPQAARYASVGGLRAVHAQALPGRSVVVLEYADRVYPQDLAVARTIARHGFREDVRSARAASLAIQVAERPPAPR